MPDCREMDMPDTGDNNPNIPVVSLMRRPFLLSRSLLFMLEQAGKLYFCTSNQKNVFQEIQKQPYVEICASGENFSWLRLNGKVVFSQDLAIKENIQEASPLVKSIYQTPDNPEFEVFYLDEAVATLSDFSGNPPQTYEL